MKDGGAQRGEDIHLHLYTEVQRDEENRPDRDKEISTEFRIAANHARPFDPHAIVQGKTAARQEHEERRPQLESDAVKVHRAVIVGGESAAANRGHGMGHSDAEIDAAEHIDDRCHHGKEEVDLKECHRHVAQARHHAIHGRPCALGVIHVDRACPRLREERDEDNDDAETADPRRHHPPKKNAVGKGAE